MRSPLLRQHIYPKPLHWAIVDNRDLRANPSSTGDENVTPRDSQSRLENRSNARTKSLTERAIDTFGCARKLIKKGFFLLVRRSLGSSSSDEPEEEWSDVHHQGEGSIPPK
jgi:hypothetical protein